MFSPFACISHRQMRKISAIRIFTIIYLMDKIPSATYYLHIYRCALDPKLRQPFPPSPHMQTVSRAERDTEKLKTLLHLPGTD